MKEDFDFEDIGKQTPYRTPERFFEEVQRKVMERTEAEKRKSHRRTLILAVAAMAAVVAGLLFIPSFVQDDEAVVKSSADVLAADRNITIDMDTWIKELSDEELEELVSFSENDIFLN